MLGSWSALHLYSLPIVLFHMITFTFILSSNY